MDSPTSPSPTPLLGRRSLSLTVACAVAFLFQFQAFAFAYGPDFRRLGASLQLPWLPTFIFVTSFVGSAFAVALWWRMRRWAVWGFLATTATQSLPFVYAGKLSPTMLLLPTLVGGAAAWNWARLR
jgi:hypothetical protein